MMTRCSKIKRITLFFCLLLGRPVWSFHVRPIVNTLTLPEQQAHRTTSHPAKNQDEDDGTWIDEGDNDVQNVKRRALLYNVFGAGLLAASGVSATYLFRTAVYTPQDFVRLPQTQFIAALGDPNQSQGSNAQDWGFWRLDPGPRGVWLKDFDRTFSSTVEAPSGWKFDANDWWLEEHGLIMEAPAFPLQEGRYLVTGGRMTTTGLTIGKDGSWKLDEGTLYDVTHLPCRSARYSGALPSEANPRDFPVMPGATMPSVPGARKQDYAVLFVVGKEKV